MREECITLPPKAGVETISALRQEMLNTLSRLSAGDSLLLDLNALERFDTSLGQLIESLKVTARQKGFSIAFQGIEPHKNVCAMLNCDSVLEASAGGRP